MPPLYWWSAFETGLLGIYGGYNVVTKKIEKGGPE